MLTVIIINYNLMDLKEIVEQLIEIENERCRNYLEKIQL
mgnify:CR=1 FL=1